jgi:hypothetical protein
MDKVTHVICSPMRRTLDPALLSFAPVFERSVVMSVFAPLRALGFGASSRGSTREDLELMYEGQPISFKGLEEGWERQHTSSTVSLKETIQSHLLFIAKKALEDLEASRSLDRSIEILVITHDGLLTWLLDNGRGNCPQPWARQV